MSIANIMHAAEISSDKMILEWNTAKVQISGGNLCVNGTMTNKSNGLTIIQLNDFIMRVTYTDKDGQQKKFIGRPVSFCFARSQPAVFAK